MFKIVFRKIKILKWEVHYFEYLKHQNLINILKKILSFYYNTYNIIIFVGKVGIENKIEKTNKLGNVSLWVSY